jgi:hypothetical protein
VSGRASRAGLLALAALGVAWLGPARAEDCIKTYNKKGEVVGRFCADGLVDPGPGGGAGTDGKTRMAEDPGPAPDPKGVPAGGKGHRRALPKGLEIRCTPAQKAAGQRCMGVFDLSL